MCTAVSFKTRDHYFGRTLDLEYHYNEQVVITPRAYLLPFRKIGQMRRHYALIGMATVADGYPLYYEATNEKGLSMAGLNFPGNAFYPGETAGKENIAPFEFIPWVLGQCDDVQQARELLQRINLVNVPFGQEFPLSPLHWMIADRDACIVVESMKDGLHIHENPACVMTNNPPFPMQLMNLNNYMHLSCEPAVNRFGGNIPLQAYSRGMGAMGLPGDLSSMSRFVRAAFVRANSLCGESEEESVSQFFHILGAVEQQRGCVRLEKGNEITVYTSCCNTDKGIYYYTTYDNRCITGVDMHKEDLAGGRLICYPLRLEQNIVMEK